MIQTKHLRDLENGRADYEDSRERNVYGILVDNHVRQKQDLRQDKTYGP